MIDLLISTITPFMLSLAALYVLQLLAFRFLFKHSGYLILRLFVLPGVIIHELSHALLCVAFNHEINKISFLSTDGSDAMGYVHHSYRPTTYQRLGNIFIALAPALGGVLSIYYLLYFFGLDFTVIPFSNPFQLTNQLYELTLPSILLMAYLATSISITMSPSTTDYRGSLPALLFLLIVVLGMSYIANGSVTNVLFYTKIYLDFFSFHVFQAIMVSVLMLIPLFSLLYLVSLLVKKKQPLPS